MPGRMVGLVVSTAARGSWVLATVLAAVADGGGWDVSGSFSRFFSVSSSLDGVKSLPVSE